MTNNGVPHLAGGDLVIVGSGGFGRETAQAVQALNERRAVWRLLGFLDEDPAKHGARVDGIPVLGGIDQIRQLPDASVVVCTGRPGDYLSRPRIVAELGLPKERFAKIVHPAATVSASSSIGPGCVALAQVVLTAAVRVGSHVAIMPHVTLTDDNVIADFAAHVRRLPRRGVRVGRAEYIGAGRLCARDAPSVTFARWHGRGCDLQYPGERGLGRRTCAPPAGRRRSARTRSRGGALTPADRHLIWMAGVSWDGIRGTDRHMVSAMTRHARVLWVDPPVSPMTPATRRAGLPRTFKPLISPVDERVTRLTPVALPGLSRPVTRVATAPLVHAQVRWTVRRLGIMPFAVVASHLDTALGRWEDTVVKVLFGTDDYVAGARLAGLSADRLRKLERRSLARADVVVAISAELADKWAALGAEPVVIPNGCNLARGSSDTLPPAVLDLPAPVVGLVGQLSERIDLDVLNAIVDAGFSLLVVGPADPGWEPHRFPLLIARPGVHYVGRVPAEAVPSYLAAMDVGITPYVHSQFNRASFPLKTLEYLGAGRPVVSTDLPAARLLSDDLARSSQAALGDQILALAANPADFVGAVRRMGGDPGRPAVAKRDHVLAGQSPAIADSCRAFAERHSWSSRADMFATVIGLSSSGQDYPDPSLAELQP